MASTSIFSRRAMPRRADHWCCCCTAFPRWPIPGARLCRRWPRAGSTRSHPTTAAMAAAPAGAATPTIHEALAALPRPRKHYQWYYATRTANAQIMHCRQGVHNFLRAYYHHKSADWKGNKPHRLAGWTAEELAKMPTYYIMDLFDDMPAAVGKEMPSAAEIAANQWLTDRKAH